MFQNVTFLFGSRTERQKQERQNVKNERAEINNLKFQQFNPLPNTLDQVSPLQSWGTIPSPRFFNQFRCFFKDILALSLQHSDPAHSFLVKL